MIPHPIYSVFREFYFAFHPVKGKRTLEWCFLRMVYNPRTTDKRIQRDTDECLIVSFFFFSHLLNRKKTQQEENRKMCAIFLSLLQMGAREDIIIFLLIEIFIGLYCLFYFFTFFSFTCHKEHFIFYSTIIEK